MSSQQSMRGLKSGLTLEWPQSLGVYDKYEQAQKSVDFLSDHEFPVENCMIVGTELKQVERVTGRLTTGRVALGGLLSGVWMGLFIGLIFSFFGTGGALAIILSTVAFGALFGRHLGARRVRRHARPAGLQLGEPDRRHPLRGARRAQARRGRPGAARPAPGPHRVAADVLTAEDRRRSRARQRPGQTEGRLPREPAWSSCRTIVELRGLEPLTPSMPWRCATSCATAPPP